MQSLLCSKSFTYCICFGRYKCEKNIVIVISSLINPMKDQVSRLSLLGVSAISIGDINSTAAIEKVESGEFLSFTDHQNLGLHLATLDGEEC